MHSPSLGRALTILAGLTAALLFAASPARAGSYEVTACFGAENNAWSAVSTSNYTTAYASCPADIASVANGNTGILARNVGGAGNASYMAASWMNFAAPSGAYLSRIRGRIHLAGEIGGWADGLFSSDCNCWIYGGPGAYTAGYTDFDRGSLRASSLSALVRCQQASGCPRDQQYGLVSLANVVVTVNDDGGASLTNGRGCLWTCASWFRGTKYLLGYDASDNVGVKRIFPEIHTTNGVVYPHVANQACDYTRPAPCPGSATWYGEVDLSGLPDGCQLLRLVAEDAAGNYSNADKTICVDQTAPPQPTGVTVSGGSAWRSYAGRMVSFNAPAQGAGQSPLRQVQRACRAGTTDCREWEFDYDGTSTGHQHSEGTAFAGPGEYELSMRFRDIAGNEGPWSDAVLMRFDNQRPGPADPAKANGWLNATEAAGYDQFVRLGVDSFEPVSKIAGYSLTTNGADPDETVDAAGDKAGVAYRVNALPEGTTRIKARAISHAGLGSASVQSAEIRVDKTRPSVAAESAPDPDVWQAQGPVITLRGVDQAGLSGMGAAPDNEDYRTGAYVEYVLDGGVAQYARGEVATVTAGTGEHVVTYKAVDLAGNASEVRTLRFKVDDVVPGAAAPASPDGWLASEEADAYQQGLQLADPAAHGPSGIAGYSVTTDGSEPDDTLDVEGESFAIEELPQGVTTVRARAVSGAGKVGPSGAAEVRVDRSAPETSLPSPVPDPQAWHRQAQTLSVAAADQADLSGVESITLRVDGGETKRHAADRATETVSEDGRHTITYAARDRAGNESVEKTATFRIDATAPETAAFEAPDLAQPLKVVAVVADKLSGVASGTIEMRRVAGGEWMSLLARPGQAATRLLPDGGRLAAWIPDGGLPDGTYEFRVRVVDVAGNERVSDRAVDGSKFERTAPFRYGSRITAGIVAPVSKVAKSRRCPKAGRRPASRKRAKRCRAENKRRKRLVKPGETLVTERLITFGKTGLVRGQLLDAAGRPVPDATVRLRATQRAVGATPSEAGVSRTDSLGRFTFRAPRGPSRTIHVEYEGDATHAPASATLVLKVSARTSVKATPKTLRNGQKVRISGKLGGGALPPKGKVVELQAIVGKRWQTVATMRTTAKGAWRFSYRFERTRRSTVYRFRARIRREAAYPFELGHSKEVAVRVRP